MNLFPLLSYPTLLLFLLFLISQLLIESEKVFHSPKLAYYGRSAASFLALFLCATYGTLASAGLNVFGYGGLGQWTTARAFKWCMWNFTGVWFEVDDEGGVLQRVRPAVLVGNHQTELDVLVLGHVMPRFCSVTAKTSLKWVPFLGWFMALSKTVFIERRSRTQAITAFDAAAQQMRSQRQSVFIFPEGTRSYYSHPDMLHFKKGAFHLAIQAQVPIIPVVVANYSNVLDMKKKIFRMGIIGIRILEPVETTGMAKEDVQSLLDTVRGRMMEALVELTEEAKRTGVAVIPEKVGDEKMEGQVNGLVEGSGVDGGLNAAA